METRKRIVDSARGDQPFDLVLQSVQLVNVLTHEIYPADIGITGERIALVAPAGRFDLRTKEKMDCQGLWAVPGFIDGHVHNESSMTTPARWAEAILPEGTTTVCTDPHEIGNVLGLEGVRYMLQASQGLPLRYYVTAPSCVPAVPHLESAGAVFTAQEVAEMLRWERVIAVAEAMDFVGLAHQVGNITAIAEAGQQAEVPVEGHAPMVSERLLQAYLAAAGPRASDHESLSADNMIEKARAGCLIYARVNPTLDTTQEVVQAMSQVEDKRMFGMCTDDNAPNHILQNGHMNYGMRSLISAGVDPVTVIQMATINVANHYGLWGLGAIAPGWLADIVLLDDLQQVRVRHVITSGKLRVKDGALLTPIEEPVKPRLENSVHLPADLSVESFLPQVEGREACRVHALNLSNLINTQLESLELPCQNGRVRFPLPEGVSLAAVVGRHGQGNPPSLAFITGYPLQSGAVASTVSHDSHNLVIIGKTPEDMFAAAQALAQSGGGLVALREGRVIAEIKLPIAGLMSPLPLPEIAQQVTHFEQSLPELGLMPYFPWHILALALPVIPQVRLTDLGLANTTTQQFIPMQA